MGAPTGAEQAIYQSPAHKFQVRALVQIDYPTPTALLTEDFGGPALDETIWAFFQPEGSLITTDGQLTLSIDSVNAPNGILRPPSIWSKPNKVFPTNKSDPFSLEFRCRPVYASTTDITQTYLATAFRVCGIDNNPSVGGSIIGVDFNQQLGTRLMMPDGTVVNDMGLDSGFHTYRLDWDGSNYSIYLDGSLQATMSGTFGFLTFRGADFISIGVQGISSNVNAIWTQIEVDYIHMISATNIPENPVTPIWALAPQTINGHQWDYLPSVISGQITVDKNNDVDACEIVCLGYSNTIAGERRNLLTDFQFANRDIQVSSRVSDTNGNWTSWKTIFFGTIDDAQYEISENEDITIRISCRDKYRRQLQRTFITSTFADFSTAISGVPNSQNVGQIVSYILTKDAGISSSNYVIENSTLVPKVVNFVNQSALSIIQELADDIVWEMFVDHQDSGKLHFQSWQFNIANPYVFSTSVETFLVNRTIGSSSQTGQIEVTFEQANLDPFFAVYPVNRWPNGAAIIQVPSRIVQTVGDIANSNPIHVQRWRRENRLFGSVEITTTCQDWLEMNLAVTVDDPDYLNLTSTLPVFMIDGWEYIWTDDKDFTAKITLALQEVDLLKAMRKFV